MELLPFALPPHSRIQWVNKKIKESWEPRLEAARDAYWFVERYSVYQKLRKCALITVNSQHMDSFKKEIEGFGAFFLPIKKTVAREGFNHMDKEAKEGQPFNWHGVLAKEMEDAYAFAEAYRKDDIVTQGMMLGYPTCCIEHFNECLPKGYFDPIFQMADRSLEITKKKDEHFIRLTDEAYHITSPLLRYTGIRIVPHIPCSFNCEGSKKIAEDWIRLARDYEQSGIEHAIMMLSMPMEWDCLRGIAYISSPVFKIEANSLTCHPKYVVQKEGTHFPEEAPTGLKFPWNAFKRGRQKV